MGEASMLDAAVVAIYLVLSFVLGIFGGKILGADTTKSDGYFPAGRRMPGWLTGISAAVTALNADVAPAYCGLAVVVGLPICWFYLSRFSMSMLIAGILFAPKWRRLGVVTGPEFYDARFGGSGGKFVRVYYSVYSVVIGMIPWMGAGLLAVHLIFGPVFHIESKATTMLIVLPVLLAYVWATGYSGVLITDLMQTAIILIANIVLLGAVLLCFGGPSGLVEQITAVIPDRAGEILSLTPVPGHRVFGPLVVLAWFIVPTIGYGGWVGTEGQRVFSSRNSKEAAKVWTWGVAALFAMLLVITLPALGLIASNPTLYSAEPSQREVAYAMLLHDYLPSGLLGLALAALLAAVMSTLSGHMNYAGQTLMNDAWGVLVGTGTDRQKIWIGRIFSAVVLGLTVIVVFQADTLIGIAILVAGLFGASATLNWGQWWWWRVNVWSWAAAFLGGPLIYFGLGLALKCLPWWQAQLAAGGESMANNLDMMKAVISLVLSTVLWVCVTLATQPHDMQRLKDFYRRAKPMGAWGPVRRAVVAEDPAFAVPPGSPILEGLGTAALGASWVICGVLAVSQLFVGRYGQAALLGGLMLVLAFLFKTAFGWYMRRLEV